MSDNKQAPLSAEKLEKQRADQAMTASETRYRRLFETANDGILILDAQTGAIADANPFLTNLLGYTRDELLGRKLWEIGVFKDIVASEASFAELQSKEYIRYEDLPLQTKDGRQIKVEFISNVYLVDNAKVIQCNIRDITDRRRAEDALRQTEYEKSVKSKIAQIFLTTPDEKIFGDILQVILKTVDSRFGVFAYLDENGDLVCPSMTREVWAACQIPDKSIRFPRETWGESIWARAINEKRSLWKNEPGKVPQGHIPIENVLVSPIISQGEVIGHFELANRKGGYGQDQKDWLESICEYIAPLLNERLERDRKDNARKRVEDVLRESEKRFRSIFDNSNDGIVVTDATTRKFLFGNPAICQMLGYAPEELMALGVNDIHPQKDLPAVIEAFGKQIRREIEIAEIPVQRKDGSVFYADISSFPIELEGRTLMAGVFRDITERKQAEEALQKLNAELEERVVLRTVELETTNKELEAFCYSVSHDLRAPLRGMEGFSRVLLEDHAASLNPDAQDSLHRISAAAQRMGDLIDDLLKLSRITRAPMKSEPADLGALAAEVAAELRQSQPERIVEFVIGRTPAVKGDVPLLRVALENLLGNAWKFTGKHPQARIEFGMTDRAGEAVFFVRDNGAGFDMAFVGKLFGAFQRLHTSSEFPGNGIGLASTQRIIRRHGGRIWAESAPGGETTFYFTIKT